MDRRKDWSGGLALAIGLGLALGVFAVGITGGHVGLDDWGYTSGCPFVKGGLCLNNVARAFCDFGYGAIWMPVTFISYMLDVSAFGDSWYAYHAINVALHLVNVALAYLLLVKVLSVAGGSDKPALSLACAIAAAIWAVHPMRAEAVTFVAARKEMLWTLFALMGLMAFHVHLAQQSFSPYAIAMLCFVLAVLSKPTAMCFPFLALSVAWLERRLDRKVLLSLLPMLMLAVAAGALTLHSQAHPTNAVSVDIYDTTIAWRILNATVALGLYGWYSLWPVGIHMDYRAVFNGWPVDGWLGLGAFLAMVIAVTIAFVRLSCDGRRIMLGALMMLIFSIGPTLGVFGYVNGDQAMADRYSYFPHIAMALLMAWAVRPCLAKKQLRIPTLIAAAAVAASCAALAVPVVRSYENGYLACSRALAMDPENWRALRIVGNEYCARQNRMDEGIEMLRKSLRLRKSQLTADSLAYVLAIRGAEGDFAEVRRLGAAQAENPKLDEGGMMLDALGIASMREGNWSGAARFFRESLMVRNRNHSPDWSMLYLGLNLANLGNRAEAVRVLSQAAKSKLTPVSSRAQSALSKIATDTAAHPFTWQ